MKRKKIVALKRCKTCSNADFFQVYAHISGVLRSQEVFMSRVPKNVMFILYNDSDQRITLTENVSVYLPVKLSRIVLQNREHPSCMRLEECSSSCWWAGCVGTAGEY